MVAILEKTCLLIAIIWVTKKCLFNVAKLNIKYFMECKNASSLAVKSVLAIVNEKSCVKFRESWHFYIVDRIQCLMNPFLERETWVSIT